MVSNILSGSTTYYWRVRGTNINGTSLFSGNYSFTTAQVLSAPTLISPANGAIGISLTPNMSWQTVSGATSYNIQIATDLAFNNIIYNVNPSISSQSVPSGTLALNTLYFWRVRSSNAGGSGPFSAT